jgi:ABC-2 type transport system ATP-binding protein
LPDAIIVSDLAKRYGSTVALDGLSFRMPAGQLTGFLGPNGAGKTTTFRSLLGLTRPDSGSMEVLGMRVGPDTPRIVRRVGAIVDEPGLLKALSGRDNLIVAAHTLEGGHERIDSLLEFVGLENDADRKIDGYSKGMRQRLALAASLLSDPDLVILDEPLDGLDPGGQVQVRAKLRQLVEENGKTVVVSSHNLGDIEQLADHVVVINRGKLVSEGTLTSLLGDNTTKSYWVKVAEPARAVEVLAAAGFDVAVGPDGLNVSSDEGELIARTLARADIYPSELASSRTRLEEVFLRLTDGGSL